MKATITIDGKACEIEFPDVEQVPRLALTKKEAAEALGVSQQTIWRLASMDKITKTSYGTYPVISLNAHLESEVKKGKR